MHEYIETSKRITSFTKSYRLDVVFCNKGYRCQTKLGSLGKKDFTMPHGPSTVTEWDSRGLAMGWEYLWRGEIGTVPRVLGILGKTASQSASTHSNHCSGHLCTVLKWVLNLKNILKWCLPLLGCSYKGHCSHIFTLLHPSHARKIQMPSDEQTDVRGNWSSMQRTMYVRLSNDWLRSQPTRNCYPMSNRASPQNSTILGFLASGNCQTTNARCCGHSFQC